MRPKLWRCALVPVAWILAGCMDLDAPTACTTNPERCLDAADADQAETAIDAPVDDADATAMTDGSMDACASTSPASEPCGKCGTRKYVCGESGWAPGTCEGEGPCSPGDTDMMSTTKCAYFFDVPSRLCNAKCAWGDLCTTPKGWHPIAAPPTALTGRHYHSAVWTGTQMIVWGGANDAVAANGGVYDMQSNTWKMMSAPPTALSTGRYHHAAVWTGTQMVVFGGTDQSANVRKDAASYDPSTDTWKMLNPTSLVPRGEFGAVWSTTTKQLLVWGGFATACSTSGDCGDGAAYDPATDTWTAIPAAPIAGRYRPGIAWTGAAMMVWGGKSEATGGPLNDGALYNPSTKTWTKLPAAPAALEVRYGHAVLPLASTTVLVYGGVGGPAIDFEGNGAIFDLTKSTWKMVTSPTSSALTPPARSNVAGWTSPGRFWIWGGLTGGTTSSFSSSGASYDPAADAWMMMDASKSPAARHDATVVSTGNAAIVWGGQGESTFFNDGSVFVP